MGWSPQFVQGLGSGSIVPEYELRFVDIRGSVGNSATVSSSSGGLRVEAGTVQIQGTSVIPQKWSVSFGGWSLGLVGDIRQIAPRVRRGQFAELWCRLNGFGSFERIAMGTLEGLNGSRGLWRVRFRDLISAFQNSLSNNIAGSYDRFQIFNRAGIAETTLTAGWNTADSSMSVADGSDFSVPSGGPALAKCFVGSDYFFVKFTGKSGSSLSGVSGVAYPVGTIAVQNLSNGAAIKYSPWIKGAPWIIMGKILTSTGAGGNGAFDKYPRHWSVGGKISADVYDHFDARENRALMRRSDGSYDYVWSTAIESPWANGFRDLVNFAATAGQWPVQRQGFVSWRGASDPTGKEMGYEPRIVAHLGTSHIHEILSHEFYHPSIGNHYAATRAQVKPNVGGTSVTIQGATNFTSSRVPALPYLEEITRDLTRHYDDDDGSGADKRVEMAQGDLNRMKGWDLYPSEKLSLRVSLQMAVLCAGDVIEITTPFLSGLYMGHGESFASQRAMVLNCSYVFGSGSAVLHLGILSGRERR